MMREVLMLLAGSDEEKSEGNSRPPSDASVGDVEPLPFASEVDIIHESTASEMTELKRKIRLKMASRKFARRRKEDSTSNVSILAQHQAELIKLMQVEKRLKESKREMAHTGSRANRECHVLMRELHSSSTVTFDLAAQIGPLSPRYDMLHDLGPTSVTTSIQPVRADWAVADQVSCALKNVREAIKALTSERETISALWFKIFKGWRIVECRRRGSRYAVLATKRFAGIKRHQLRDRVWDNASDPQKRIVLNLLYSDFGLLSGVTAIENSASAFVSQELHEFPAPFLCRKLTSIHGITDDMTRSTYVKQTLLDRSHDQSYIEAEEVVGVVIQDATSGVDVDILLLYDTRAVCHAEVATCKDPELCERVLAHWETTHIG